MAADPVEQIDSMKGLRDEGAKYGLSFPGGTSKVDARAQIIAARDAGKSPDEPVTVEKARPERGDRVHVDRVNEQGAWWCPVCDTGNMSGNRECGGCGAARDGDEVVV